MTGNESDNTTHYYYYEDELVPMCNLETYNGITGACYISIFFLSTCGNSMLLYMLVRFEDLRKVTMIYILFLAIFDLLFTVTLPFWAVDYLYQWIFGEFACMVLTGVYFVGIYGSLIQLTAMTVDRFFAIVVRSQWLTRRRRLNGAKGACATALVISLAACLKDVLSSSAQHSQAYTCNSASSSENQEGYYAQFSLLFLLPLVIIIFCYGKILHTLMSTTTRQKYRTVLVVLCIVTAFFVCWGPYHILMILMSVNEDKSCESKNRVALAFFICRIVAYFHCCVNPLLYTLRGKSRSILWSLLLCSPELRQTGSERRVTDPSYSNIAQHSLVLRAKEQNETELKTL